MKRSFILTPEFAANLKELAKKQSGLMGEAYKTFVQVEDEQGSYKLVEFRVEQDEAGYLKISFEA